MIRPFTCLCLAAMLGSGLYLYSEKHRTALLDRDISHVMHDAEAARDRTGLLRAEWALLNEPGRLQGLADKYLKLQPMAPTQFVQLAELSSRLPAPAAAPPEGTTDDDATAAIDTPPADEQAAPPTTIAAPSPKATPSPVKLAHADAHPKPASHVAVADRQPAAPHDGMPPLGAKLPLAAPQPVGARLFSAMARPIRPMPRPPVVAAAPSYVQAAPFIGSSLGGAVSLPPPVPYGAGAR